MDYQAKGHRVELVGRETTAAARPGEHSVTLATGAVRQVYLDSATFL